ncbi:MAG: OprD family outer membrane porin [Gammaproteobacteria bacterium]|nr:OprD family outer membrane porin [Gammaproteobacteria bacterium]
MRKINVILLQSLCLMFIVAEVQAIAPQETQNDRGEQHILPSIQYFQVDGNLRTYFFQRDYTKPSLADQKAFSFGGKLNALTEDCFYGFRLGATAYTAQPLGLNSDNPNKVDITLPGKPLTTVGQAFLQYENNYFLTRMGNQLISSPWLNEADSRIIPATYQGFYAKITPITDFDLTAMRLIRFKSRIKGGFSKTNLYSPINQVTPINALGNQTVIGTLALGAQYKYCDFKVQAWGYQFYNIATLYYGDISYTMDTGNLVKPLVGVQIAHEHNDGNPAFNAARVAKKNSDVYGALFGAEIADGSVTIGYNNIPKHTGSFENGNIVSPYTAGYASDPLYTTSMIAGLIDKSAGSATKGTVQYSFFEKQLHFLLSYARYKTSPFIPNTSEANFDVTYKPNEQCKNLSLRYRVGLLRHNPAFGRFIYNRLMVQYDFS